MKAKEKELQAQSYITVPMPMSMRIKIDKLAQTKKWTVAQVCRELLAAALGETK